MSATARTPVIALEEHYCDPIVTAHFKGPSGHQPALRERLEDVGALRLAAMDEAGIDIQVLSHAAPATQRLSGDTAIDVARQANDRLHAMVQLHTTRFAGFGVLPTAEPDAAANELERVVDRLGFKGAMVHGLTNGAFLDEKRFWPIFERAQALDVPIYLHPAIPHPAVIEAYYRDYVADFPSILSAGWGFTVETATQAIRMVLSGVFDAYPRLKIIIGHMGEGLPFSLWRIDQAMSRKGNRSLDFRAAFSEHFWITTSGNFSNPALLCSVMELGADRIMFSVDYPYVENTEGSAWLQQLPLCREDREKIMSGNARRLLRL